MAQTEGHYSTTWRDPDTGEVCVDIFFLNAQALRTLQAEGIPEVIYKNGHDFAEHMHRVGAVRDDFIQPDGSRIPAMQAAPDEDMLVTQVVYVTKGVWKSPDACPYQNRLYRHGHLSAVYYYQVDGDFNGIDTDTPDGQPAIVDFEADGKIRSLNRYKNGRETTANTDFLPSALKATRNAMNPWWDQASKAPMLVIPNLPSLSQFVSRPPAPAPVVPDDYTP